MESSSRMRLCLRRNYRGSDHLGAAANYDDHIEMKQDQENVINSSNAPILAAEAISVELVNEEDEQVEIDDLDVRAHETEGNADNQPRPAGTAEQALQASLESDNQLAGDQDLVQSSSPVTPGYVPSELDERIVLELPSSMVRPLRVIRGTFQVSCTSLRLTFLSFTYSDLICFLIIKFIC
jgi:hypothetical protein